MRRFTGSLCAGLLAMLVPGMAAAQEGIVKSIGSGRLVLELPAGRALLPYESNRPIDRAGRVERLVIYIHGSGHREVKLSPAAQASLGVARRADTLLLFPQFLKDRDRVAHKLPPEVLSWAGHWQWGDLSADAHRISSFEVTDRIVGDLVRRYPSIREVLIVGNSGGGQFSHRYAALSRLEDDLTAAGKIIRFTYLASNPSNYLYFSAKRASASGSMAVPTAAAIRGCPTYNSYGYGLDNLNAYAKRSSLADISQRFLRRRIVFFIGNDDDDPDHPELDRNCAAELQGEQRFARSRNYWTHLQDQLRQPALANLRRICIPHGIHAGRTIWSTPCGQFYLNGTGTCQPAPCPDK
jgi:hypothetical protein